MIKKLFNKKIQEIEEGKKLKDIEIRVAKMDVYSMFEYLNEENSCELGIEVILKKLISREAGSKRRFIEMTDSRFKLDKCFELVIYILEHNNGTPKILRYCEKFLFMFSDVVRENDEKNDKDYDAKINNALFFATKKFEKKDKSARTECKISDRSNYLKR